MISVKVSYTVKPEFVAQNKQHITTFLADFRKLNHLHFFYNVFLQEDGQTFLHISLYENEDIQTQVLNVPSFLEFQQQRDDSGLISAPQIETLALIGSSLSLLG